MYLLCRFFLDYNVLSFVLHYCILPKHVGPLRQYPSLPLTIRITFMCFWLFARSHVQFFWGSSFTTFHSYFINAS